MAKGSNVVTPEFRVSYPAVFEPKLNTLSKKEEFSLVAVFPKEADFTKLNAAIKEAIIEKWGEKQALWPKNLKMPLRDHSEKMKTDPKTGKEYMPEGYEAGAKWCNLKNSKHRPQIVDKNLSPIVDEAEFYGGCYAKASVRAFAYDQAGNRGVSLSLQNLQKTRDGDAFGGSRKMAEDEFEAIEESGSADKLFD